MKWKWPWVSRKRFDELQDVHEGCIAGYDQRLEQQDAVHKLEVNRLRHQHHKAIEQRSEQLAELIRQLTEFRYRYDPGQDKYFLTIALDPRMMLYGASPRGNLELIAKHAAHEVMTEILSAKFIAPRDYIDTGKPPRTRL